MIGSESSSKTIQEAEKLFDKGEELSRKGLFCWFPDYDAAASLFERSGQLMKSASKIFEAMNCFVRAGQCHSKSYSWFLAAKNYTQAAECAQDAAKAKQSSQFYSQAATLYAKHSPKAPDLVSKSYMMAGLVLIQSQDQAIQATEQFMKVCHVLQKEGREIICRYAYHEMISSLLQKGHIEQAESICIMAMKAAEKHKEATLWSQYCFSTLILSSCSKSFNESFLVKYKKTSMMNLCSSGMLKCIETWIEGMQKSDSRILSECISNSLIRNLPIKSIHSLAQTCIKNMSRNCDNK